MKVIKSYKDRETGTLSFERSPEIWTPSIVHDVKHGLIESEIAEGIEKLRNFSCGHSEERDFYYYLRVFNFKSNNNKNRWVKTHCLGEYFPPRGSCLGTSSIMDIKTQYPIPLLRELQEQGIKKIGQIVYYKRTVCHWRTFYRFSIPLSGGDIHSGHPLHAPKGQYILLSALSDIANRDFGDLFSQSASPEGDVHLLLYPNGEFCLTNGIAGNPTYWGEVL